MPAELCISGALSPWLCRTSHALCMGCGVSRHRTPSTESHAVPNKAGYRFHIACMLPLPPPLCSGAEQAQCQQDNKQRACFSLICKKDNFNMQQVKQQCRLTLTAKLLELHESLAFPPVSPDSICQALIFFSLLPAKLEISNFYFILSLMYHRYQQGRMIAWHVQRAD